MHINPDDEAIDPFYSACARLGVALLCHTGHETSVSFVGAPSDDSLGNPLLLRRPLRAGVKVIAAHCASEGHGRDDDGSRRECFDLLMKMMAEPSWEPLLFADISALVIFRRLKYFGRILDQPQLHSRLVLAVVAAVEQTHTDA